MKIYNSLSKEKQEFYPLREGEVLMYVCGLTPYDSAHIGHARTYVAFDMIKRYLSSKGYSVYHIQNVTDVEDKIIMRCKETGADPGELTEKFQNEANMLLQKLNVLKADNYPKVTKHIEDIIFLVKTLLEKGVAYETESGIYFDISKFPEYGKLSGQDINAMKAGVRKDVAEGKKSHLDFALWKKSKGDILEFDSPWGKGRPGWHIECSAMALKYVKRPLDIHGGARDLIFPHHENEIAQSEAATCEPFARFWMHTGFLTVEHEKMSKSLGNFITLRDALDKHSPNALRLFYLQSHYRSPLDYEEHLIESAASSVERIFNSLRMLREAIASDKADMADEAFRRETDGLITSFYESMDDDFDTPQALASLFSLLRVMNSHLQKENPDRIQLQKIEEISERMLFILGLEEEKSSISDKKDEIFSILSRFSDDNATSAESALELLIEIRTNARKEKDYEKSDRIRDLLESAGIILEDDSGKARWRLK